MFKKLASALLITSVLSTSALATPEIEQLDEYLHDKNVTTSTWAKYSTVEGYELGLLDNTNLSKNIDLSVSISRVDFIDVVMNYVRLNMTDFQIQNVVHNNYIEIDFKDTNSYNVSLATKLDIVNGISENEFAPDRNITREEVSVILDRAETVIDFGSKEVLPLPELRGFKDYEEISFWAEQSVANLVSKEIINGTGDGYFKPKGLTSGEQSIKMLVSLVESRKY